MRTDTLWLLGQFGIFLEIIGALYIAAHQTALHSKIGRLFKDIWGFREIPRLIEMMRTQTRTDITGFLLLAAGLTLQLVGNFFR